MKLNNEMQIGKAGEYFVCADLISKGYICFPSEQGLPYDVILDTGDRLYKVQVKTTQKAKNIPQRKTSIPAYIFNIKRCGKGNLKRINNKDVDLFALVSLEDRIVGYLPNRSVKQTMNFRVPKYRGQYRDENIKIKPNGTYLDELTIENCLSQLKLFKPEDFR